MKLLFLPFSIGTGIVAGFLSKKLFDLAWSVFNDEEPPEPEHREVAWGRLLAALAIEGAIFRVVRGAVERGFRRGFLAMTGSWPGEEEPERT